MMKHPGSIILYIPHKSALKYSLVRTRQIWTGERRTPKNPAVKAKDMAPIDELPAIWMISGNVLPTKPKVRPVSKPVMNGKRKRIGDVGIPSSMKNRLKFFTAPEFSIASLKNITPRIRMITSRAKPCLNAARMDLIV